MSHSSEKTHNALSAWDAEAQGVEAALQRCAALKIEIDMMPLQGATMDEIEGARAYWLQCEWRALFRQHAFWFASATQEAALRAMRPLWPWFGAVEFERLCRAAVALSHGQTWELTPVSRDGGFDLIYREQIESPNSWLELLSLAQCKLYRSPLGVTETREFCGAMVVRGASCGVLFCASELTLEARRELHAFNSRGMGARAFGLCGALLKDYFACAQAIALAWQEVFEASNRAGRVEWLRQKRTHQKEALEIWERAALGFSR